MNPLALPLMFCVLAAPADDRAVKAPAVVPALQRRIDRALDRGVRFISGRQLPDGSWQIKGTRNSRLTGGLTALAGLALLHGGAPPSSPRVTRARTFVRRWMTGDLTAATGTLPDTNTYAMGLSLAFLLEAGEPPRSPVTERLTKLLATGAGSSGHWAYRPIGPGFPAALGNLSTSLYAVLGLRAAWRHGIPVETASLRRLMSNLRHTRRRGGWGYAPAGNWSGAYLAPYFSGTTNGLAAYLMAGEILGLWSTPEKALDDPVVIGAVAWIGRHFTPERGPAGAASQEPIFREPYYGLYAAERAGCLLTLRRFGEVDWYLRGARFLVPRQKSGGAWLPPRAVTLRYGMYYDATVTTSFAVLFLARGTVAVSTASLAVVGAKTAWGFDDLDLAAGPRLDGKDFADLVAGALAAFERLSAQEREERGRRLALLGPRVFGPLVEALGSDSVSRRRTAIEILRALFDEDFDFEPEAAPAARRRAVRMWEHWRKLASPMLVLRGGRLVLGG